MHEIGYRHDPEPNIYATSVKKTQRCANCAFAWKAEGGLVCERPVRPHATEPNNSCDMWERMGSHSKMREEL